jgi:hypothetical protein
MNTCESRIPPLSKPTIHPDPLRGFPRDDTQHCGQSVGLTSFLDASGQEHWYCRHPLHREDVEAQALRADAIRLRDVILGMEPSRVERMHRARQEYEDEAKWGHEGGHALRPEPNPDGSITLKDGWGENWGKSEAELTRDVRGPQASIR